MVEDQKMTDPLDSTTLDWVALFTGISRASLENGTSQANDSAPGGPPPSDGGSSHGAKAKKAAGETAGGAPGAPPGGAGDMTLGSARITEQTLGPPVGAGPGADALYAFMAADGSGLIGQQASPMAASLNESGRALQASMAATLKLFGTWKHAVAVIQEDQKKGKGQAALKSVNDAAGAIGKGEGAMTEATQKYYDAVMKGSAVVDELAAQVDKFSGANHEVTAMFAKDAAQKQGRVVGHNQDAVTEEKEKIEERKKQISEYFSLAEKLLKPQEWAEAVQTVALFVDEKLTSAIMASTDKLDSLKAQLEESKQQLASLQDTAMAEKILGAQKTASAEMHSLDAVLKKFERLGKDVKAAQTLVIKELGKSNATKPAAQAVKERDTVSKQATNAAGLVRGYLAGAEPVLKNVIHLGTNYHAAMSVAGQHGTWLKGQHDGDVPQHPQEYWDAIIKTAKRNVDACQEFADYIRVTQVQAKEALDYLTKDTGSTFLAGYNQIPDALEDAIIGPDT